MLRDMWAKACTAQMKSPSAVALKPQPATECGTCTAHVILLTHQEEEQLHKTRPRVAQQMPECCGARADSSDEMHSTSAGASGKSYATSQARSCRALCVQQTEEELAFQVVTSCCCGQSHTHTRPSEDLVASRSALRNSCITVGWDLQQTAVGLQRNARGTDVKGTGCSRGWRRHVPQHSHERLDAEKPAGSCRGGLLHLSPLTTHP